LRTVVQRVLNCNVMVGGEITGKIDKGLLVYLGVEKNDSIEDLEYMVDKIVNLRIFNDEEGKMNLSLEHLPNHGILVVSQFTLCADTRKGRRPSYADAAPPEIAQEMYDEFIELLEKRGYTPERGKFGEIMKVKYINDGPVTIILDSKKKI